MSLEGAGLGIDPNGQTNPNSHETYYGIEMTGVEHVQLRLSGGNDSFTINDDACVGTCTFTDSSHHAFTPSLLPAPELEVYGGGGDDSFTVTGIGAATTIAGGPGNDAVTVRSPAADLMSILGRLTVDGNNDLVTQVTPVLDTDSQKIVHDFLTTPLVVTPIAGTCQVVPNQTGSCSGSTTGSVYYQAAFVPILADTDSTPGNGSALDVRTVIITSDGTLLQQLVQQRGVLEYGIQAVGQQKRDSFNNLLWLDPSGAETTTNTGVQDIVILHVGDTGYPGSPIWLDAQGHQTTTNTGIPVIVDVPAGTTGARQVFVDPSFNKVFSSSGANVLANGNFSTFVPSNGTGGSWTSTNIDYAGGWFPYGYFILNSNGAGNTDPTISQTMTNLLPGITYTVSGQFINVYSQYGSPATSASFAATVTAPFGTGSQTLGQVTKTKNQGATWSPFSFNFTATGTQATLYLAGETNGIDASYAVYGITVIPINAPSYVTDFGTGSVNLWIDKAGRETSDSSQTGKPSLFPVYATQLVPFVRIADVINSGYGGSDTLTIVSTGSSTDLNATLATYQIAVDQLSAGLPVLHGNDALPSGVTSYYQHPTAAFYFGGEAVLDPFTGVQLTYAGGEPVRDLFTGAVLTDPFGVALVHAAGDPMLHIAGEPVVHQRGEDQLYVGGEPVFDETGNQVFTGLQPFTHDADQGVIQNRRSTVYDLIQANGSPVAINAPTFNAPSQAFANGISTATVLDVTALANYTLKSGDQVSVTVYDGTDIYNLASSEYTVSGNQVLLNNLAHPTSDAVIVKLVIATPALHASGDLQQYYGDEAALAGQPIIDATGLPTRDSHNVVVTYTGTTFTASESETHVYQPGQKISLLAPPLTGSVGVVVGGVTLGSGDFTVSGGLLTITKPGLTAGLNAVVTYTAGVATETKHESYYYVPPATGHQSILLGTTPVTGPAVQVSIGGVILAPNVDFTISGHTLTILRSSGLTGGAQILVTYVGPVLHGRGDPVWVQATTGTGYVEATYSGGQPVLTLGNEPLLYRGGEQDYYSTTDHVQVAQTVNRLTVTGTGGLPADILYGGLGSVSLSLGSGNDLVTVAATHTGSTTIDTGAGNDRVAVRSISGATTVLTSGGNDTVYVGSEAGQWPGGFTNVRGNANGIAAALVVDGGTGTDVVTVDDTFDTTNNNGTLTSSLLSGIFGGVGGTLGYSNLEELDINLGLAAASNTFTIKSTHGSQTLAASTNVTLGLGNDTVNVQAIAGPTTISTGDGNDTVNVGSTTGNGGDPVVGSTLDSILNALLTVNAGTGADTLQAYDSGETSANTGELEPAALTGLGMTLGIAYQGFETLNLWLSNGADHFYVGGTPAGSTLTLNAGSETPQLNQYSDVINIGGTGGQATIQGGGGNDDIRVNYDANGNQTFRNGLGGTLTLQGGPDGDLYEIGLSGLPGSAGPLTLINVEEVAAATDTGVNQLRIFGTDNPDFFLLRANALYGFVAALQEDSQGLPVANGTMERVNYDGGINGNLEIEGRDGNDTFVLDDTLAPTTIFGGDGNDTFQIGQVYASPRDGSNPDNGLNDGLGLYGTNDYFSTIQTTQGYLSNGISQTATLFGGNGDDSFTVYHNTAELFLFGEADDDTFRVRSFVRVNPNDPRAPFTNINGGAGADFITYTVDAPVRIDGGDGLDTLVVVGSDFGDTYVVTDKGVFGAGLYVTFQNVEKVTVDGQEGNDIFYVQSTSPDVILELVGGKGSDTFNIGGGPAAGRSRSSRTASPATAA